MVKYKNSGDDNLIYFTSTILEKFMTKFLSDKIDTIMKWAENRKLRYREPFELSWNDLQFFSEIGIFVSDIFVCFWFFHIAYHKIVIVEIEILIVLFTCLFIHNLPVIHILPFVSYYSYLFLKKKKKNKKTKRK